MELDAVLKGEQAEETAQPTEQPSADKGRDEKGRFAKGDKPEQAEPPSEQDDKEPADPQAKAFYAKAQDEKRKRQELERKLQELQSKPVEQQPPPDVLENPQGYAQHLQQQVQLNLLNERLNLSEGFAKEKYGDESVEEAKELFRKAAEADPGLIHKLYSEVNPYGWVMKWSKSHKLMSEMGDDPAAYLERQKAEIRAQVEAEYAQRGRQPPSVPPPSLANAPSAPVSEPAWSGPTSLNSILKPKR